MKVGVIGLGFMGAAHVAAISADPLSELVAVVSNNLKAREGDFSEIGGNLTLGKRKFDFSNVRKYDQWQDVLTDGQIDALTICLPTDLHAAVTTAALEAGKHVLCEKPMALTTSECDRVMEAANSSGSTLMIGHVLRFWPEYLALREFVKDEKFGQIRQATFIRKCGTPDWSNWLPDEARSGGAVMDLLIHDVDQILMLFGMPERVTAKRLMPGDTLMASFIYKQGPVVRLQGGWFASESPFHMSFQVRADKGEMNWLPEGLAISDVKGLTTEVDVQAADAYAAEVHYFLDCCRGRTQPLKCLPRESADAVRVALALKESRMRDGEQVRCSG